MDALEFQQTQRGSTPNPASATKKRKKDTTFEVWNQARDNLMEVCATAREAWDYADENMVVVKREETVLEAPPKRKKVEKSLEEIEFTDAGHYQCLHGSMQAKGKQQTWWIDKELPMDGSATDEKIRNSAVLLRQVPATTVTDWVSKKFTVCDEMDCWPVYCQNDSNKGKLRQMTHRIRKSIARVCADKR